MGSGYAVHIPWQDNNPLNKPSPPTHKHTRSHYYHDEFFQHHSPGSLELEELSQRERDNYIQVDRYIMCICMCVELFL